MKVKRVLQQELMCEVTVIDEIKNFDIITEKMDDDFYTFPLGTNMMMWLNQDGLLGELECIFPEQIDEEIVLNNQNAVVKVGFPLVEIEEAVTVSKAKVFRSEAYFTLYFSEIKTYDKCIISKNLSFYVNNDELIAIKAVIS
ncbi:MULTISPECIES: hypothetical protein [Listeria]|uniref:hypothetical protein n=1 Tax=Listeria TaxID=1637 RepID=UPI000B58B73D|nr:MULTISPECIES: hypothetical protein [Listeria]